MSNRAARQAARRRFETNEPDNTPPSSPQPMDLPDGSVLTMNGRTLAAGPAEIRGALQQIAENLKYGHTYRHRPDGADIADATGTIAARLRIEKPP